MKASSATDTRADRMFRTLGRLTVSFSRSPEVRGPLNAAIQAWFHLLILERRRGGDWLWRQSKRFLMRYGRARAPFMAHHLQVDPDHMGDLGRIQDLEDRLFGITGYWIDTAPDHAVKREMRCPFSEQLKKCPEICTELVYALEVATFSELNPGYTLDPLETVLSRGHEHCEFSHRLRRAD
jgi:hypothetical protein